jgi:hypothetical protein
MSVARTVTAPAPRVAAPRIRAPIRALVYAAAITLWGSLAFYGSSYYRLDLADRMRAAEHAALKPSGSIGLLYAYVGTTLVLLLLLYSVRKRVRALQGLGKLNRWLNVHIFFGIAGPAMITLHAGFRATGAIAVGYWAMIGVMLSGFVGFYLLRHVRGALSEADDDAFGIDAELLALDCELAERYRFEPEDLERLGDRREIDRGARMGAVPALFYLLWRSLRDLAAVVGIEPRSPVERRLDARERRRLRTLLRKRASAGRRRAFLRQTTQLFHYWHAVHKPFTIVLFLMMGVHIGVAIWLGYAIPTP